MSNFFEELDRVPLGLYRHFKGKYFYVDQFLRNDEGCHFYSYFDVCNPNAGKFVRSSNDFLSVIDDKGVLIADREDNVTGQIHRFERVRDLNFQLGSISTEQLISELRRRKDSPIHELDIEGLRSDITAIDYVVGIEYEECEDYPKGVDTVNSFWTRADAETALVTTPNPRAGVFKRVFIKCD